MANDHSAAMDENPQSSDRGTLLTETCKVTSPDVDLTNFYITPKHKKVLATLDSIDKYTAKRYQETQNLINIARETYSVDYVRCVITIARNNRKLLNYIELSEEKEKDTLEAIDSLRNIGCGTREEDLIRLQHAIEYVSDLEDCLFRKGLLKKMAFSLRLTNKISRKGDETG